MPISDSRVAALRIPPGDSSKPLTRVDLGARRHVDPRSVDDSRWNSVFLSEGSCPGPISCGFLRGFRRQLFWQAARQRRGGIYATNLIGRLKKNPAEAYLLGRRSGKSHVVLMVAVGDGRGRPAVVTHSVYGTVLPSG